LHTCQVIDPVLSYVKYGTASSLTQKERTYLTEKADRENFKRKERRIKRKQVRKEKRAIKKEKEGKGNESPAKNRLRKLSKEFFAGVSGTEGEKKEKKLV
tara:strand:+ start:594 stop:893 length:300 start_codon:yes stop_codon:yes gene_type:complete